MELPKDLKYTDEHEWVLVEGNVATIGITDYAQGELGDIVFVELPNVDDEFKQGDAFGTIEAVKAVSDLFSPVSGKVVEVNEMLEDQPEIINSSPYDEGWMIKIELSDASEVDSLLSVEKYKDQIS